MTLIGIDGGGSTVRVAITTDDLDIIAEHTGTTVNPNIVGHDVASETIRQAVRDVLDQAGINASQINAAGIGVGGAPADSSADWLRETLEGVLPDAQYALSSDHEIALVGAVGERQGILLLSGTGSIAYGVNRNGDSTLVGGWGWLLGDEGSGYWIGLQALKAAILHREGRGRTTMLTEPVLEQIGVTDRAEIIAWTYAEPRNRNIAALAQLVLEHAADPVAQYIIERAAYELALQATTVRQQLGMEDLPIAFTGSLLVNANALSELVCDLLKLDTHPVSQHPAVIGAAILARDTLKED